MGVLLAINGACGRTASVLGRVAAETDGFDLAAALEAEGHPSIGKPYPHAEGVLVQSRLEKKVDVLIDFSLPAGSIARLRECARKGIAVVIGTTGFTEEQRSEIRECSGRIPCLVASNMSLGVGVLLRFLPEIRRALGPGFDVDVVETHHRTKADVPSGTARTLAGCMGGNLPVHALRSGDEVGEHRVVFGGPGERIEVVHRATSREVFARGALRAARFVAGASPGLYSMLDFIGKA